MSEKIKKAESSGKTKVPNTIETGQPRIVTSGYLVQTTSVTDLAMPQRLCTFDNMCQDAAVHNSIDITNLLVANANYQGSFVPPEGASKKSDIAANFLNYNIRNMGYGTWLGAINNMNTDLKNGFSIQSIVLEKRTYGPYKGNLVLKKLAPRDQKSVYGWLWDKNFRELQGFVQKPNLKQRKMPFNNSFGGGLTALSTAKYYDGKYPIIRLPEMLHCTFNSTNNNPQGDSPLMHCYSAWMEKKLVEEYEIIGVSKDLGGIVVLRVPSELIAKANDPSTFPNEAREYSDLQQNTADLHAGKSSFILLQSDTDDVSKKYHYDVDLKGIDGGGKQYNTSEIIDQKKKAIYNTFGTGFLLLGQDSVGSNALALSANSTHSYYVDRILLHKKEVLETQLAPRLLAANDVYLDYKDMPIWEPGNPYEVNIDDMGKIIQRVGSVNKLTPKALESYYKKMGLSVEGIDELDFSDKGQSRAGESQGSSGTGSVGTGGATSTANMENKSLKKNFIIQEEDETGITIIDTVTGEPYFIDK